jgi:hypothetical protein
MAGAEPSAPELRPFVPNVAFLPVRPCSFLDLNRFSGPVKRRAVGLATTDGLDDGTSVAPGGVGETTGRWVVALVAGVLIAMDLFFVNR